MYSIGYSQVSRGSPASQKKMQYRSKGKSCGYYMRIVFFFSSLIQSLIIVSLVLFLVYGKTEDSPSTSRIQDLEESFSRLSIENVVLKGQRKNLTSWLNTTLIEKARNDWDLAKHRLVANSSLILIQAMDKNQQQCLAELFACNSKIPTTMNLLGNCNCGPSEQLHARLRLVESNFTQTIQRMRREMDQTVKERDNINLEAIHLRREKSSHEKEVNFFRQKCKDDFSQSLSGISNVSKSFLEKIDSLFPSHIAFQLTCPNQREHLEQIRTNCTSLSMEVEDRFQRYLNNVGEKVSNIQAESSRLKAENTLLSDDYRRCSTNRTGLIREHKQNLDKLQQKHDEDKEKLLMDKLKLHGDIEVLNNHVKYTSRVIDHLTEQNRQLNKSCVSKTGLSGSSYGTGAGVLASKIASYGLNKQGSTGTGYLGSSLGSSSSIGSASNKLASTGTGSSSSSSGSSSSIGSAHNKPASTGTGSSRSSLGSSSSIGSAYNKPASTGTGSSSSSSGSSSSIGSAYNKPASTGTGSSRSSLGSSSSIGSTFNKPASTGTGSSRSSLGSSSSIGSTLNKPASTGTGSSSSSSGSSSSIGSTFNKPASTGTGSSSSSSGSSSSIGSTFNKPASTGTGSSSSSSGSTGSTSKGFGLGWFGQSKTGSATGKGPSTGNSNTGLGSSSGAGRTSGLGGGSIVAQHLRDLQRIINPSESDEKQALSRIMG
ncbi:plasmalemma vesicle associated protein a isoform X2 [Trematomus bernacchii]|uniref:plasmalemma vesicle associated protein a isoform X2 n=1 Tax=Trematomus bernacchii TaxID=40690 RepID=UPI00146DD81D|nr:plasmalemma vesicle associated protein a isoform X2 [Trematomus bernacchii]